ncbi:MAG TPA: hypothetical protein VGP07_04170 [Polyangia bacterium]|jgi:hypothetical protein
MEDPIAPDDAKFDHRFVRKRRGIAYRQKRRTNVMGGRRRDKDEDEDEEQKPSDAPIGRETDVLVHQDLENEPMNALLEALRTVAREDEAEISTFSATPADVDQGISEKDRARITRRILRALAADKTETEKTEQAGQVLPKATAAATVLRIDGGRVPPVPRRQRRVFLATAGGLFASAAGLAIWLRPSAHEPPVPPYTVMASGGEKETRGGGAPNSGGDETTTPTQRLRAGSELVIAVRPDTAVSGPVTARVFLVQGQAITEPHTTTEVASSGAIELRLHGAELVYQSQGPAVVRVVVGRPGALRALDPRASAPTVPGSTAWRVLTVPVDLVPR